MGIESFIRVIYYGKERLESTCGPFLLLLCSLDVSINLLVVRTVLAGEPPPYCRV
jgi:hypothetical protein